MFYTYILKSLKSNSYYVGSTGNILNRVIRHNANLVKSTKRGVPWNLVYKEKFDTLSKAKKRELQIKSWKSRLAIERLIKTFQNFI